MLNIYKIFDFFHNCIVLKIVYLLFFDESQKHILHINWFWMTFTDFL
jgi:hypothetical protein